MKALFSVEMGQKGLACCFLNAFSAVCCFLKYVTHCLSSFFSRRFNSTVRIIEKSTSVSPLIRSITHLATASRLSVARKENCFDISFMNGCILFVLCKDTFFFSYFKEKCAGYFSHAFFQSIFNRNVLLFEFCQVLDSANHLAGVAVFVVVPTYNLYLICIVVNLRNHSLCCIEE